jgi:DNA-binding NarL/FixJ family response regulator
MQTFDKKVVFLVDDDDVFLKILKRHLDMKNAFTVHTFTTGEQCVSNLSMRPDIVILDHNLNRSGGQLNGQQTLARLIDGGHQPRVIMLSGQEDGDLVYELVRLGVRDYVIKGPSALEELDDILAEYMRGN